MAVQNQRFEIGPLPCGASLPSHGWMHRALATRSSRLAQRVAQVYTCARSFARCTQWPDPGSLMLEAGDWRGVMGFAIYKVWGTWNHPDAATGRPKATASRREVCEQASQRGDPSMQKGNAAEAATGHEQRTAEMLGVLMLADKPRRVKGLDTCARTLMLISPSSPLTDPSVVHGFWRSKLYLKQYLQSIMPRIAVCRAWQRCTCMPAIDTDCTAASSRVVLERRGGGGGLAAVEA